jgi:hypothetical protein
LILKFIGKQFIEKPDPSAFLGMIDDDPTPRLADLTHRRLELIPAIATCGGKDIAGQALRMNTNQRGRSFAQVSLDENHVGRRAISGCRLVANDFEGPMLGWQNRRCNLFNSHFSLVREF